MKQWLNRSSKDTRWGQAIDAVALLFFVFFVLGPLFFVFSKAANLEFSPAMQEALVTSFGIAAAVTAIDLLMGIPMAWMLARKRFPLKELVDTLIDLPLIIPTSALGLSIALFWGSSGLGLLQPGIAMIVLLHIAFTFPYVVRTTQAAMLELDGDLARAASTLGASPFLAFRTVWLPLVRAGAVSGALLAFTRSLGETGATMLVAGAAKTVPILTVYYKNAAPSDLNAALTLSAVFLIASALIFVLVRQQLGVKRMRLGQVNAQLERRLSRLGQVSDGASLLFLLAIVLLPSFYFLKFTDLNFFSGPSLQAIGISFAVAGAATALSFVFGIPLALFIASNKRGSGLVKLLNELSMIMPTVTIGLSLALFWAGRAPEAVVLVLAHTAMIFPYFVGSVSEVLAEMDENLTQVARTLGATPLHAFRTVVLPLIKPTLVAGLVVAFMRSVSETGGTLAVSQNIQTVPILIVNLSKAGQNAQAASAAVLLLALSIALVLVLRWSSKKKW
ncbi:Molybdate/tungstate transport system permease protein WtpB [uncultured archaeon]|nr:Molybdate/tungstate transport system permease protein WtpB [uncultured archaeon]